MPSHSVSERVSYRMTAQLGKSCPIMHIHSVSTNLDDRTLAAMIFGRFIRSFIDNFDFRTHLRSATEKEEGRSQQQID